jgi:hypothetical protein
MSKQYILDWKYTSFQLTFSRKGQIFLSKTEVDKWLTEKLARDIFTEVQIKVKDREDE